MLLLSNQILSIEFLKSMLSLEVWMIDLTLTFLLLFGSEMQTFGVNAKSLRSEI